MKTLLFHRLLIVLCLALLPASAFAQAPRLKQALPLASSKVYPMQEGYVDANGVMIYYKIIGHGEPLLVVHGGPGASHDYFLPYLLPLARHNRVVFIDERGSGRSQQLENPAAYTVENMVEDVEAVRQSLGLGKMSLSGILMEGCWPRPTR